MMCDMIDYIYVLDFNLYLYAQTQTTFKHNAYCDFGKHA